ncbi:MAG: hypothetical protein WCJ71_02170 [Candidatus Omnitrophota bacterium]
MRKLMAVFFLLALMSGGFSPTAFAADCTKDTPADQVGDWLGTFGKTGIEKDQIMAQRKADRLMACAQKQAKAVATAAQKAGNDMKKKLGF